MKGKKQDRNAQRIGQLEVVVLVSFIIILENIMNIIIIVTKLWRHIEVIEKRMMQWELLVILDHACHSTQDIHQGIREVVKRAANISTDTMFVALTAEG
jgi:hypothetical protein